MQIVVLDGRTTNPGDISWEPLTELGKLTVYDDTPYELIRERAGAAEAVIMNRTIMDRAILKELPCLRFLGALATGYNTIDIAAAEELGITVCNVPLYCAETVAQHAFSLLLALCNRAEYYSETVRDGGWKRAEEESAFSPMFELSGKTLGIFGFGAIGSAVARLGLAFGMKVLLCSRTRKEAPAGCSWVSLRELFQKSDVVSIHCPLTEETRGLINSSLLSLMKPSAFLLNTSRGAVVAEADLAEALNTGRLAGAGMDVLSQEPPAPEHPLLSAKNCIITPHVAWSSREARQRLIGIVAENLRCFLAGVPQNVVKQKRDKGEKQYE